jgi:hypothetical protein
VCVDLEQIVTEGKESDNRGELKRKIKCVGNHLEVWGSEGK